MPPEVGRPLRMAISNALTTSVASAFESIDQPTILRLNASRTAQQYSQPFTSAALGNIGNPQLIWNETMEFAVDQIVGGDHATEPYDSHRPGQAVDSCETSGPTLCAGRT